MKHKVFVGVGHGGRDSGACGGGMLEKDVNLTMAVAMAEELQRHNMEVQLSRWQDDEGSLQKEIDACNGFAPHLAVEIHNNAGGGNGFEVYCQTTKHQDASRKLAESLEQQVVAMGQNSRGIKTRQHNGGDYYGWLRGCHCPAVLCEGFFLDHPEDRRMADTPEKQQAFGKAYAKGVLTYLGITPIEGLYRVQIGAFAKKENAEKMAAQLSHQGYSTIIQQGGKQHG